MFRRRSPSVPPIPPPVEPPAATTSAEAPASAEDEREAAARADERIAMLLDGRTICKVVVVPGKLVNFVVT